MPAVPGGEEGGTGDGQEQAGDEQRIVLDRRRLDGAGGVAPPIGDVSVGEQRRQLLGHGEGIGPVVRVHHDDVGLRDLGVGLGQRGVGVDAESAVGVVGEVGQTPDHAGDRDVTHRREGTCAAAPEAGHGTSGAHPGERDPVADPHAGPRAPTR